MNICELSTRRVIAVPQSEISIRMTLTADSILPVVDQSIKEPKLSDLSYKSNSP